MTLGQKIKALRTANGMTQEELAEKLFVTRTAVSKWETDNGYPSVDSLKEISKLFSVSIDELVSEEEIEKQEKTEKQDKRKFYYASVFFTALTAVSVFLLSYFRLFERFGFITVIFVVGYVVCAFLSKPKNRSFKSQRQRILYFVSRVIVMIVLASAVMGMFIKF